MILPVFTSNYRISTSYLEVIRKLNRFGITPTGKEEKDRIILKEHLKKEFEEQECSLIRNEYKKNEVNKNDLDISLWADYHRMYFGV